MRLNADNRRILYNDFLTLPRQANAVYKTWEQYLNESVPFEKITFDGQFAAENRDVVFIMPTHPLVKQALNCFEDEPVKCAIKSTTTKITAGTYPFVIYEWLYKGVKPDNKLQVITLENIPNDVILEAIYNSSDTSADFSIINEQALEKLHYQIWQYAKSDYQSVAEQIIGFKKESLSSSQAARKRTIEDRLQKETNPRIIRMKQSQLASQESNYREKLDSLNEEIRQSDIVTRKLVIGILKVEN